MTPIPSDPEDKKLSELMDKLLKDSKRDYKSSELDKALAEEEFLLSRHRDKSIEEILSESREILRSSSPSAASSSPLCSGRSSSSSLSGGDVAIFIGAIGLLLLLLYGMWRLLY
jgi:hypothetical protein